LLAARSEAAGGPRAYLNALRRSSSNKVMAGTSLDLALAVTGHTKDVAREHYLRVNAASQRATISRLTEVYGLQEAVNGPAKAAPICILEGEAMLLLNAITCFEGVLLQNSGATFWNTPELARAENSDQLGCGSMAERGD